MQLLLQLLARLRKEYGVNHLFFERVLALRALHIGHQPFKTLIYFFVLDLFLPEVSDEFLLSYFHGMHLLPFKLLNFSNKLIDKVSGLAVSPLELGSPHLLNLDFNLTAVILAVPLGRSGKVSGRSLPAEFGFINLLREQAMGS